MQTAATAHVLGFLYGFLPALSAYVLIINSKLCRFAFFAGMLAIIALSFRFYTGNGLMLVAEDIVAALAQVPPAVLLGVVAAFLIAPHFAQLFRRRRAP